MVQSERLMSTIDGGIGSVLRAMRISLVIAVTITGRFAIFFAKKHPKSHLVNKWGKFTASYKRTRLNLKNNKMNFKINNIHYFILIHKIHFKLIKNVNMSPVGLGDCYELNQL